MENNDFKFSLKKNGWIFVIFISTLLFGIFCSVIKPLTANMINNQADSIPTVAINVQDPFIYEREKQFHLSKVIPKYDQVITAIEDFHRDHGSYPNNLADLVPQYLSEEPGIYLRSGEYLSYTLEPWQADTPPFTFLVSGHYPGFAFMHGWDLVYCPETYAGCAPSGDRHIKDFKVNDRWIWHHSSAL